MTSSNYFILAQDSNTTTPRLSYNSKKRGQAYCVYFVEATVIHQEEYHKSNCRFETDKKALKFLLIKTNNNKTTTNQPNVHTHTQRSNKLKD